DADGAVQLVGRNAVLRVRQQPDRHHPLIQTDGRILHDGADLYGELAAGMNLRTAPDTARGDEMNVGALAGRAGNGAAAPAKLDSGGKANVRVREEPNGLNQGLWG